MKYTAKQHFWTVINLVYFVGSEKYYVSDCFYGGVHDSKLVEDLLRVSWTHAAYYDMSGVGNGWYGWGLGDWGWVGDMDGGASDGYGWWMGDMVYFLKSGGRYKGWTGLELGGTVPFTNYAFLMYFKGKPFSGEAFHVSKFAEFKELT